MTLPEVNPYAPPITASVQTRKRTSSGSLSISVVSGIGALAFIAFTVMLLRSSPPDRKAGTMFLGNVPVLIGLAISAVRSTGISVYVAVSAAGVQVAITIAMLMLIGSDVDAPLVIGINAAIILCCLAIALWAWLFNRRFLSAQYSTQDGN